MTPSLYPVYLLSFFLMGLAIPLTSQARATFIPYVEIKETFISSKTAELKENSEITRVSPGLNYSLDLPNMDVSVDYRLDALFYNNDSSENTQNQSLKLLSIFTHNPQKWESKIFSTISQATFDVDGIRSLNPGIQSNNTQELRTFGFGSNYSGKIKKTINIKTGLLADYADFENESSSNGLVLSLNLDNQQVINKFFWSAAVRSQQESAGGNDEYINTSLVSLNYKLNPRLITFINSVFTETKNSDLNQTSSSIGLNWIPSRLSHVRVSYGERDEDPTYSLDTSVRKKRLTLNINYQEEVITARSSVINEIINPDGLISNTQTLIITPVLQKRGSINLNIQGKRSNTGLSWFNQRRFQDNSSSAFEKIEGIGFIYTRKLSSYSSISFNVNKENSEALETNKVTKVKLSYQKTLSKKLDLFMNISNSKQESNVTANQNEENLLGFLLALKF